MSKLLKHLIIRNLETHTLAKVPDVAGVYIFTDENENILYVGKSRKLKSRIKAYFAKDITIKTKRLMADAKKFSYIKVDSELEALLLEAKLVRVYLPKYNIQLKDDKHPLYIVITKEKYPQVLTRRKMTVNDADYFGPFPSSTNVRYVLKNIRKIFPYSQHTVGIRPCFDSHLNLCNPCPNFIEHLEEDSEKKELLRAYRKNIYYIKLLLNGRLKFLKNKLLTKMEKHSKEEKFEKAENVRIKIERLDYITHPSIPIINFLEDPNFLENKRKKELDSLKSMLSVYVKLEKDIKRIECFDIAHLAGTYPTASMITFIDGYPDKNLYRHFKIRQKKGESDFSSMEEVAKRRHKYLATWGVPDLIIVDGGKPQVSAFLNAFKTDKIPVVGITKRFESLVIPRSVNGSPKYITRKIPISPALDLIQRLRDEAHRFARRYHHHLVSKSLLDADI